VSVYTSFVMVTTISSSVDVESLSLRSSMDLLHRKKHSSYLWHLHSPSAQNTTTFLDIPSYTAC
jgi:hypothetical protein